MLPISHNSDEIAVEKFITAVAARLANLHAPEPGEDDAARWTDERIAENLMRRTLRGDEIEVAAHCLLLYKRQAPRETLVRASTRFLRDGLSAYRAIDAAVSDELALPSGADF